MLSVFRTTDRDTRVPFVAVALFIGLALLLLVNLVSAITCTFVASDSCAGYDIKFLGVQNETGGWNNAHAELDPVSGWSSRIILTFNLTGISEDLEQFPVLVQLDSTVINYSKTQDAGQDLRFVEPTTLRILPHEIELWNESGTSYVWVGAPSISAETDSIALYFDNPFAIDGQNPSAVWNDDYVAVWHFNNDLGSSSQVVDSTSYENHGTAWNMDATNRILSDSGNAFTFDGSTEYITVPGSESLDGMDVFTIEAWAYRTGTKNYPGIFTRNNSFELYSRQFENDIHFDSRRRTTRARWTIDPRLSDSAWEYLAVTYNMTSTENDPAIYRNGSAQTVFEESPGEGSFTIEGAELHIGNNSLNPGNSWQGRIDEIRFSNVLRSAEWIEASYRSMEGTFITYSAEEPNEEFAFYANSICCSYDGILTNACGTTALRLELQNNSHVQQANYTDYEFNACIGTNQQRGVSCEYVDGACSAGYSCVLSMQTNYATGDNGTNAHVAECGFYTRQLCCAYLPVCIQETGVCWGTIQEAVDNATSGQTVVITDTRTYAENVTVTTKSLTITSNGTSYPTLRSSGTLFSMAGSGTRELNLSRMNWFLAGNGSTLRGVTTDAGSKSFRITDVNVEFNGTNASGTRSIFQFSTASHVIDRVNVTSHQAYYFIDTSAGANVTLNNSRLIGAVLPGIGGASIGTGSSFENTFINITQGSAFSLSSFSSAVRLTNITVISNSTTSAAVELSSNSVFENSFINATAQDGLDIGGSGIVRNSVIYAENALTYGAYAAGIEEGAFVQDSVLEGSVNDLAFDFGGISNGTRNLTLVNVTFDPFDIDNILLNANDTMFMTVQSYLDVSVNDTAGSPVTAATVDVADVYASPVLSTLTAGSGSIERQNVTFLTRHVNLTDTIDTYYDNHTIEASRPGFTPNSTSVNMSTNQDIFITIDTGKVCIQETSVCWGTIQEAVDNATAGQTVVITDNKTYTESVTVNKNLTITSNGSGYPTILGNNATPLDLNGLFTYSISKLNMSVTGSAANLEALEVGQGSTQFATITDVTFWINTTGSASSALYINGGGVVIVDRVNFTVVNASAATVSGTGSSSSFLNITNTQFLSLGAHTGYQVDFGIVRAENITINSSAGYGLSCSRNGCIIRNLTSYAYGTGVILDGYNATLEDSFINTSSPSGGYPLITAVNTYVSNVVFQSAATGVINTYSSAGANGLVIADSTFTSAGGVSLSVDFPSSSSNLTSNITIINSTVSVTDGIAFDPGDCTVEKNNTCLVHFQSYLDVYVNDTAGSAVSDASVSGTSAQGLEVFSVSTNGTGRIASQNVTYANLTNNGSMTFTTYRDNHTIDASKAGYIGNSTSVNMTSNQNLALTITGLTCGELTQSAIMGDNLSINGSTCFTITAPNVVLDCNGYTIDGDDTANTVGVYVLNTTNATIRNCRVEDFGIGIFFNASNTSYASNNTVSSSRQTGVRFLNAHFNTVTNGTWTETSLATNGELFYLTSSSNNLLANSSLFGGNGDVFVFSSVVVNNRFSNLTITDSNPSIYFDPSYLNNAFDTATTVNGQPVYYYTNGNTESANICPASDLLENLSAGWILVSDCDDIVIRNILFPSSPIGLGIYYTSNASVENVSLVSSPVDHTRLSVYSTDDSTFTNITNTERLELIASDRNVFSRVSGRSLVLNSGPANNTFINADFQSTDYCVYVTYAGGWGNTLLNSTCSQIGNPFALNSYYTNFTFTNVSFNQSRFANEAYAGNLTVNWLLDVYVELEGSPIDGANVTIANASGAMVFEGTTAASGFIAQQTLKEYVRNSSAFLDYQTPYTVTVDYGAYQPQSRSVNLTSSRTETFNLAGTVCVNETNECFPTIQEAVDNATTGQTVVITDDGTYDGNVTVSKNLTITSNGTAYPTVYGDDVRAFLFNGGSLHTISRLNISGAGSSAFTLIESSGGARDLAITDSVVWVNQTNPSAEPFYFNNYRVSLDRVNITSVNTSNLFAYSGNWTVNNSRLEGVGTAFYSSGDMVAYAKNTFINMTVYAVDGFVRVTFENVTSYSRITAYTGATLRNSSIVVTTGSALAARNDTLVTGSILQGPYAYSSSNYADNTTFIDSVLIGTTQEIQASATANTVNVTFINTTVTPNDIAYSCSYDCFFTFQNYLDVYVNVSNGSAIEDATVTLRTTYNETVVNTTTNASGRTGRQNVTYATQTNNGSATTTYYDNHTLNAFKTSVGSKTESINMSTNQFRNLTLGISFPEIPTLTAPANDSSIFDRFPTFNYTTTDNESDPIDYIITINAPTGCAAIPSINTTQTSYTSVDKLCVDREYNWTVYACDYSGCSANATPFNFTINSTVGVTLTRSFIDFGTLAASTPDTVISNSTLGDDPLPFRYNNTGNVDINVSVRAEGPLWTMEPLGTTYFQYADQGSNAWVPFTTSYVQVYENLTLETLRDLEINITVPESEPPTAKTVDITVLGVSLE